MRIAIDARALLDERLTGVGFYTLNLIHEIAKASPEADLMLFTSGTEHTLRRLPHFPYKNVEKIEMLIPNKILSLLFLLPLPLTLDTFLPRKADFWIFPNHNVIKTKRPYTLTVHDVSFDIYPRFFTLKDRLVRSLSGIRKLAEKADHLFAVSESTAEDLSVRWGIQREKITVTPLGVDHTTFVAREQPSDRTFRAMYDLNRPYLLSVATREPRKNLESVVEAYDSYRDKGGKPYPLVLVGGSGWKSHSLKKIIRDARFKEDIRILGYVPEKHKTALYRGAHVFLFPSFYEGFGLPVLEAMACGVPVITSFTSSLPEIVKDAGILLDPFNVNDLEAGIRLLLDEDKDGHLKKTFSEKGCTYAKAYSWRLTANRTLTVLRQLFIR
jgi:glycosyltransferase involved in cell wall biosynthesis